MNYQQQQIQQYLASAQQLLPSLSVSQQQQLTQQMQQSLGLLLQQDVGVTLAQAFIAANIGNPQLIFSTVQQYGFTTTTLSEIAGLVSTSDVQCLLAKNGLDW